MQKTKLLLTAALLSLATSALANEVCIQDAKLCDDGVSWVARTAPDCQFAACPDTTVLQGKIVGVSDGDTVTMLQKGNTTVRIRLAEIDAPEKSQAHGQSAKASLSRLCYGKQAKAAVQDTDRYDRKVARLFCDGEDANAAQVRAGFAWVYEKYAKDQSLYAMQDSAKSARLGLWRDKSPTPPWEYRRQNR